MRFKLLIYLISVFILVSSVSALPTISGNCSLDAPCTITATNYNATMRGCSIINLTWVGSNISNWAYGGTTSATSGLGQLWTTGQKINANTTTTYASNSTNGNAIRVNCTAIVDNARNDWYFYDTYINLTQNASLSYYTGNYLSLVTGDGLGWNLTQNFTYGATLTNLNSTGGVIGMTMARGNEYILAVAYEQSKVNSTGWRMQFDGPISMSVGRGNQVPANTLHNLLYKVLPANGTGSNRYTSVLSAFKSNPLYNDSSTSQCIYSGTGNFVISNSICNITSNYTIETGYDFNITNSTIYMRNAWVKGFRWAHWNSGWLHSIST